MDSDTIEAIEGSVMKWDCIAQGIGVNEGAGNCPLCTMFIDNGCVECPVCPVVLAIQGNNARGCSFTPYASIIMENFLTIPEWIKDVLANQEQAGRQNDLTIPITLGFIEDEIEFLISLLPKNHKLRQL